MCPFWQFSLKREKKHSKNGTDYSILFDMFVRMCSTYTYSAPQRTHIHSCTCQLQSKWVTSKTLFHFSVCHPRFDVCSLKKRTPAQRSCILRLTFFIIISPDTALFPYIDRHEWSHMKPTLCDSKSVHYEGAEELLHWFCCGDRSAPEYEQWMNQCVYNSRKERAGGWPTLDETEREGKNNIHEQWWRRKCNKNTLIQSKFSMAMREAKAKQFLMMFWKVFGQTYLFVNTFFSLLLAAATALYACVCNVVDSRCRHFYSSVFFAFSLPLRLCTRCSSCVFVARTIFCCQRLYDPCWKKTIGNKMNDNKKIYTESTRKYCE